MIKIFRILIVLLLLGIALQPSGFAQRSKKPVEVIILHTNDMHAKIDNMAKLAYFADSLRESHKYVFLMAAGDNFTGNPVVDMVEDKGYPMIDLMNACGFDVSAMGNHEFDLGQEKLKARQLQAHFPFISCNIDASGAGIIQPKPYILLKAGKYQIPVLGIIQLGENGLPDSHPSKLSGIKFTDGVKKAGEYKWLKKKYGSLIGLTHLGIELDDTLARLMPEFDLIIGGHSHTTLAKPQWEDSVMIVQTGSGLKNVGKTTLLLKKGKIVQRSYELIPLQSIKGSKPEVKALIDKYNDNKELDRVVGVCEMDIEGKDELGSLMTDAVTQQLKVDMAFQNSGGIRISSLQAGNITLKDVYKLDPFGNLVVIYNLSVAEIKSLICSSYNRDKQVDLEVSGITCTVVTNAAGQCTEVRITDLNGKPLDESREYKVGVNSYIAATYKFEHRDDGTTTYTTTAQALIDYLQAKGKVNYSGIRRVNVVKE